MELDQAMAVIAAHRVSAPPGLYRMRALMALLGDPQDSLRFVHVAGTNGKGTLCALTASVLRQAGCRTGLYTSPYVLEFRERFQIDGEMIPERALIRLVERIAPLADQVERETGERLTEFEFITALAFCWFAEQGCEIVVLETGLGGRLDATNIIPAPEAAAITSISLDHTALLGDTPEKIAGEKAGIIKPGTVVALYPEQPAGVEQVIARRCRETGSMLLIPPLNRAKVLESGLFGTRFSLDGLTLRTPFLGGHQLKNAVTALTLLSALRQRGWAISDEAVARGLVRASLPARMEVISSKPLCLLDGGHNPGCAAALRDALERFVPPPRTGVLGIMADKDSRGFLEQVGPLFSRMITVSPDHPRALPAPALAEMAAGLCPEVLPAQSAEDALRLAGEREGALVVCGSFYLAGELRPLLVKKFGG